MPQRKKVRDLWRLALRLVGPAGTVCGWMVIIGYCFHLAALSLLQDFSADLVILANASLCQSLSLPKTVTTTEQQLITILLVPVPSRKLEY